MRKKRRSSTDTVVQAMPENTFLGLLVINKIYGNVADVFSERKEI